MEEHSAEFEPADRLKAYQGMAETSRKWATVMDTKAGFLSALNLGCLAFAWSAAKLQDGNACSFGLILIATVASTASLVVALWAVLPRETLSSALGKKIVYKEDFKPVSFYGFVASKYQAGKVGHFVDDVRKLDENALANEALEQHYTISHVVQRKSRKVWISGMFCAISVVAITGGALIKGVSNWTQNHEPTQSAKVTNESKQLSTELATSRSVRESPPPRP